MSLGFASLSSGLAKGVAANAEKNERSRLKAAQIFRQLQQDNPHATMADLIKLRTQAAGGQNWLARGVADDDVLKVMADNNAEKKRIFEEQQAAAALQRRQRAEEYFSSSYMDYAGQNDDDNAAFDAWQKNLPEHLREAGSSYMTPERRNRMRSKLVTDQTTQLVQMAQNGANADAIRLEGKRLGFNGLAIDSAVHRAKQIEEDRNWQREQRNFQRQDQRMQIDTHQRNIATQGAALDNSYVSMASEAIVKGVDPLIYRDQYERAGGTNWDSVLSDARELSHSGRAAQILKIDGAIMDAIAPLIQAGTKEAREQAKLYAQEVAKAGGYFDWTNDNFEDLVHRWENKALVNYNTATRKAFLGEYSETKETLAKNYDKLLAHGNFKGAIQGELTGLIENVKRDGATLVNIGRELAGTYYFGNPALVAGQMRKAIASNPDAWAEIQDMADDDPQRVEQMKAFFDGALDPDIRRVSKNQGINAEAARRAQAVAPHKMDWDDWSKGVKEDIAVIQDELLRLEKSDPTPEEIQRVQLIMSEIASENAGITEHSFMAPRVNEMDVMSKAISQVFDRLTAIQSAQAERAKMGTMLQQDADMYQGATPPGARPDPAKLEAEKADKKAVSDALSTPGYKHVGSLFDRWSWSGGLRGGN